jgi:hypothetical protein
MITLLLVATVTAVFGSQSGTGSIEGTWTAQYQGRTFVRLELRVENGLVAGGLSVGNIQVDAQGAITSAGQPPQHLTPVFDVKRQGATLTFSRKDGADTDRFEFRLLEGGAADLQFLLSDDDRQALAASGAAVPKPIRLARQ